uniref:Uncharacterized protein n=2 Tax=Ciona intestinalis TaxID=7719 RepID=F6V980_CIOIN
MHWNDLSPQEFSFMAAPMLYTMLKSKSKWPLHRSILAKREDVLFLYLIEFDSQLPLKLNEINEDGEWPLQLALSTNQESIAHTLVSHGVDMDGCDDNGKSHLHRSLNEGNEFSALFLLNNGASVNLATHDSGNTALHIAASVKFGHDSKHDMDSITRITSLLLKKGANPNLSNSLGFTPLHISVLSKNMPVFKLLLDSPIIDLELRTRKGHVSLWLALDNNDSTFV